MAGKLVASPPDEGGVQSTSGVPSCMHLTSQSLQTSSKDLKARWKQRQNQGKRDCTAPEPFPSERRETARKLAHRHVSCHTGT